MAQQDIQISVPIIGVDIAPVAYAEQILDKGTNMTLDEVAKKSVAYGPYASVAAAHTALSSDGLNTVGTTVGISGANNTVVEYWYQGGTAQANLVEKETGITTEQMNAAIKHGVVTGTSISATTTTDDRKTADAYVAGDIFTFYDSQSDTTYYYVALESGNAGDSVVNPTKFFATTSSTQAVYQSMKVKNVSATEQQSLPTTEKQTARTNIAAVGYEAQTLTTQQKEQAAQNIGLDVVVKGDVQQSLSDAQKVQAQNNMIGKSYAPAQFSGLGKKILAKNIQQVGGVSKNVMMQAFFEDDQGNRLTNTVFVIQYDYTLGENITIPDNCVLEFDGGSISAGSGVNMNTINFNNCIINADYRSHIFTNIAFNGLQRVSVMWFGAKPDGVTDNTSIFQSLLNTIHTTAIENNFEIYVPFGIYLITDCINESANSNSQYAKNILIGEGSNTNQALNPQRDSENIKASVIYCKGELTTKPFIYGLYLIKDICFCGEVAVEGNPDDYGRYLRSKYSTTKCLQIGNDNTWSNDRRLSNVRILYFGTAIHQVNNYGSYMSDIFIARCNYGLIINNTKDKYITEQIITNLIIEFCRNVGLTINSPNVANNLKFKNLCVQFCSLDITEVGANKLQIVTNEGAITGTAIDGLYVEAWNLASDEKPLLCDFSTIALSNAHLLRGKYNFGNGSCVINVSGTVNSILNFTGYGVLIKSLFGEIIGDNVNVLDSIKAGDGTPYYGVTLLPIPSSFNSNKYISAFAGKNTAPLAYMIKDSVKQIWGKAGGQELTIPVYIGQVNNVALSTGRNKSNIIQISESGRLYYGNGNDWVARDVMGRTMSNSGGNEIPLYGSSNPTGLNNTTDIGFCFFNTKDNKPYWWTGSAWVDATGPTV